MEVSLKENQEHDLSAGGLERFLLRVVLYAGSLRQYPGCHERQCRVMSDIAEIPHQRLP
jgi:hypothetical protein